MTAHSTQHTAHIKADTGGAAVRRTVETPLGEMVIVATSEGVCLCEFSDRPALARESADLAEVFGAPIAPGTNEHADRMASQLAEYFAGERREFTVPLVMPGTEFQRAVWDRLLAIPYGKTCTYGQIALELGKPGASRAVGAANGQNRIAVVVPCHRVIDSTGALHGYGGGLWRKRRLLDLENRISGGTLWDSAAEAGVARPAR
jgi:AraC family transcriptional regulator of adaptative response/methylated-DNA-[protein]-cysteine methyltransferase